jgi:DNA polymerase III subunit epsilon
MVRGQPKIGAILPSLLDFLKSGIIIGHNIGFDLTLIATAADQHKLSCDLLNRTSVDTLRLARLYAKSPSNSLEALRAHFRIARERAHRALDDAVVNAEVFRRLAYGYTTRAKLLSDLDKPIRMARMPLGKYKGRPFKEVPLDYLRWAAHQKFDMDLLFSIRSELKKRKSGGSFSAGTNPFQGL